MKVMQKELFPLKSGGMLTILEVKGSRGEQVDLAEQGVGRPLLFYHEGPKTQFDCSYLASEHVIELGGAENETERTLYLIVGGSK